VIALRSASQLIFADDPAPEPPEENDENFEIHRKEQDDLCSGALIHALESQHGDGQYSIFLVPELDHDLFEDLEAFEEKEPEDRRYKFVREYTFAPTTQENRFFMILGDDHATFNVIRQQFELKKSIMVCNM
jgi:hypothetical protein